MNALTLLQLWGTPSTNWACSRLANTEWPVSYQPFNVLGGKRMACQAWTSRVDLPGCAKAGSGLSVNTAKPVKNSSRRKNFIAGGKCMAACAMSGLGFCLGFVKLSGCATVHTQQAKGAEMLLACCRYSSLPAVLGLSSYSELTSRAWIAEKQSMGRTGNIACGISSRSPR